MLNHEIICSAVNLYTQNNTHPVSDSILCLRHNPDHDLYFLISLKHSCTAFFVQASYSCHLHDNLFQLEKITTQGTWANLRSHHLAFLGEYPYPQMSRVPAWKVLAWKAPCLVVEVPTMCWAQGC